MQKKYVIPLVILAILIATMTFRFNVEASKSVGEVGVLKWERDRWTGDCWLKVYAVVDGKSANNLVLSNEGDQDKALEKRKLLTNIWWGLVVADLTALAIIYIRRKPKAYDPVLETYKKIFPEE